ncbi:MAG: protein kinase [Acidiferrobacterales bacterium]
MSGYHKDALPRGYQLAEYAIESVLGHGGFGVTYLARDVQLGTQVAIKEYLPHEFAARKGDTDIIPNDDDQTVATYHCGLQEFLREGQALAQFKHPNIVRVLRFLEENGTAYMVMEYEKGESLSQYLKNHGPYLNQSDLLRIFLPIMNGLHAVHEAGMLHLDIKPENIYLREDGTPMLIDFGSARQALVGPGQAQGVALTPGYAPIEQYPGNGKQGPATDVYALGASLHRCISGKRPLAAPERQQAIQKYEKDPLPPATEVGGTDYPAYVLHTIDWALQVHAAERPKSTRDMQDALMGKAHTARRAHAPGPAKFEARKPTGNTSLPPRAATTAKRAKVRVRRRGGKGWLAAAMLLAAIGIAALFYGPTLKARYPVLGDVWRSVASVGSSAAARHGPQYTVRRDGRDTEDSTSGDKSARAARPKPLNPASWRASGVSGAKVLPNSLERTLKGHTDWVQAVAISPDGKTIASAGYDRTIRIWDRSTGKLRRVLRGHGRSINAVAYSTNGAWLASAGDDGTVRLWSAGSGRQHGALQGPGYAVYTVAFSPDGSKLAASGKDRIVFVWNMRSGELLHSLNGHRDDVQAIAFSPDGKHLASGGADRRVRIWTLENGVEVASIAGHKDVILSLAYSPDGRLLASGGSKNVIKLWNARTGRLIRTFPGVRHAVLSLTFSPDGQWLATGGGGKVVRLWNVENARVAQTLRGHQGYVHAVAFAPNGAALVSASRDHTIKVWTAN